MALNSPRQGSNLALWNGQLGLNQRVNELRRTPMMGSREGSGLWGNASAAAVPPPPPVVTTVKASDFLKEQLRRVPALASTHMATSPVRGPSPALRGPSPALRFHRFLDDFGPERRCMQKPREAAPVVVRKRVQKKYDGRIHSYPHKKNGPYTCPKCKGVFATSQIFASHVSSIHYKFESRSEKKKRLMARYYKRNPTVQWVDGKLSILWGVNKKSGNAPPPPTPPPPPPPVPPPVPPQVRVFVKSECVEEFSSSSSPPPPLLGKPIGSPNIVLGKQILPSFGFGIPISSPSLVVGNPVSPPPPPLVVGKPCSPSSLVFGKPISPGLGFGRPVPPPLGFRNPISSPPGFGNPVSPPPGFENRFESLRGGEVGFLNPPGGGFGFPNGRGGTGFIKPDSPPSGFSRGGTGFPNPVSPPPGFENMYSVPGCSNPFGVQNVTVAAPRGVQIKLEIQ
ncbi:hypothetical protein ACSQ67_013440 [Phaseolus vulgaris]